jgi:hypothetical protein
MTAATNDVRSDALAIESTGGRSSRPLRELSAAN